MKNLLRYLHNWELLLIPIVATLGISVNLFYSSMVLSDGNNLFKAIHDSDFPILEEAINNLNRFDAIMVALNSGATTGELEFLSVANKKAAEIQASYEALAKLDTKHKNEIEGLISEFNAYFASAMDISLQIATKSGEPSYQQIAKMRSLRDTYMSGSVEYRNTAERYFREEINEAIIITDREQVWGWIIGKLMLMVMRHHDLPGFPGADFFTSYNQRDILDL